MSGPWEDYQSSEEGPWTDYATSPGESVVAKTESGRGQEKQPSSFKKGPSSGGVDPAMVNRFINGVLKGYAGAEQLMAHGAAYVAPERAGGWRQAADARARMFENEGRQLSERAGLNPNDADWINIAGQVASPVNWAAGAGAGAVARGLPNLARNAVQGAAVGAMQPVTGADYATEKARQTAMGAVTGPIIPAGESAIAAARAASPYAVNIAKQYARHSPEELILGHITGGLSTPITASKRVWDAIKETNAARAAASSDLYARAGSNLVKDSMASKSYREYAPILFSGVPVAYQGQ